MVDVIKNNNLQLLHVHYAIPHASAAYMAKKILETEGIHIPVITTLHGTDITLVGRDKTYAPVVLFLSIKAMPSRPCRTTCGMKPISFLRLKSPLRSFTILWTWSGSTANH
jgi:hypothetical protein